MGVKRLTSLLARFAPSCISAPRAAGMSGWTLAVDANIFVQRFFRTPPPPVGTPGATSADNEKRHLRGMYGLATYAQAIGVVPVFVFDGISRTESKVSELESRRKERERICAEYDTERARALRIAVLERIAARLLDIPTSTQGWQPATPGYPAPFSDAWPEAQPGQEPLGGMSRNLLVNGDGDGDGDSNGVQLMQAADRSVSDAVVWLETQLGSYADERSLAPKRTTIKGQLDEMELQACRNLLFHLGGSPQPNGEAPPGDAGRVLTTLRMSSRQRLATLACRSESLTPQHVEECLQLVRAMGFAAHVAESAESECVCAQLTRAGVADAVCSEDLDVMAFGGRRLVRGFFGSASGGMLLIDSERMLDALALTYAQFVDLCILCGTDFCSTIEKVGPITALKLIRQHGSIEAILATGLFRPRSGFHYEVARAVFHSGPGADAPFASRDQVRPHPLRDDAVIDHLLPLSCRPAQTASDPFSSGLVF
ncbi:hypothetical protein H4217_004183 [Coemansia sp. RSA 1939]|nr:hypothetical protein H4217_004183 [Coemansia sp. RSA 1939]KAJ2608556.1 hypothetical protein EV177_004911 [Coemansia sp. RSA 1804]